MEKISRIKTQREFDEEVKHVEMQRKACSGEI